MPHGGAPYSEASMMSPSKPPQRKLDYLTGYDDDEGQAFPLATRKHRETLAPPFPDEMREWRDGVREIQAIASNFQERRFVLPTAVDVSSTLTVGVCGRKKRSRGADEPNQDCVGIDVATGVYSVSDGLGSYENSEKASKLVGQELPRIFEHVVEQLTQQGPSAGWQDELYDAGLDVGELDTKLKLDIANETHLWRAISKNAYAFLKSFDVLRHMVDEGATTTTAVKIIEDSLTNRTFAVIAHMGDSGAMIRRAKGDVSMITVEDSLERHVPVDLLSEMRRNPDELFNVPITGQLARILMADPGKKYNYKVTYRELLSTMTKALGSKNFSPEHNKPTLYVVEMHEGDAVYLATDGIWDFLVNEDGIFDSEAVRDALLDQNDINIDHREALMDCMENVNLLADLSVAENKTDDDRALVAIKRRA